MRRPEQGLHITIVGYLKLLPPPPAGPFWCHVPNGFKRTRAEASIAKAMGQRAGVPDLIGCYRGRLFGIELKAPGVRKKLSPDQVEMHNTITLAGGVVTTLDSLEGVIEFLVVLGIPRVGRVSA